MLFMNASITGFDREGEDESHGNLDQVSGGDEVLELLRKFFMDVPLQSGRGPADVPLKQVRSSRPPPEGLARRRRRSVAWATRLHASGFSRSAATTSLAGDNCLPARHASRYFHGQTSPTADRPLRRLSPRHEMPKCVWHADFRALPVCPMTPSGSPLSTTSPGCTAADPRS